MGRNQVRRSSLDLHPIPRVGELGNGDAHQDARYCKDQQ